MKIQFKRENIEAFLKNKQNKVAFVFMAIMGVYVYLERVNLLKPLWGIVPPHFIPEIFVFFYFGCGWSALKQSLKTLILGLALTNLIIFCGLGIIGAIITMFFAFPLIIGFYVHKKFT